MAFEKSKVIKAAEKFLAQGKITAAIKEYRQIIQNDPDDLTTLNMLGDLHARAGEKEEAVQCFQRIAEHFREQEFRLKAIAMYRKIEKLKPRDPAIARELGDLYAAQGLIADARAEYLVVADAYTQAGQSKDSLRVLHKIADLDPNNTAIRLKLADGYLKERMDGDAAKAYSEAAVRLFEGGHFEQALGAYNKALELRPNDRGALKGVVSAHVALGSADEAAELLEQAVSNVSDDPELLSMLVQAYVDAEDAAGAERATGKLMTQDASNYRRYLQVAQLYLKLGQEDEAARILGDIIEQLLAGREETDLLELVNELLARNPEHIPSLRLLARIHWWQRDMDRLRGVLERLAEAAEVAGLADDERYALNQLLRLAPEEHRYRERLDKLGGSLDDGFVGVNMMDDSAMSSVPTFEGFSMGEPELSNPALPETEALEFEWNSVAEESPTPATVSFADLNEEALPAREAFGSESKQVIGDQFVSGPSHVETPEEPPKVAASPAGLLGADAAMRQELESVDFYITQGYSDIAFDTLQLLERQFGTHPEIETRRQKLEAAQAAPKAPQDEFSSAPQEEFNPAPQEFAFGDVELDAAPPVVIAEPAPSEIVASPSGSGIDPGLAEVFEEFRREAEGESVAAHEDYETHYNMATAYKEMDLLDDAIREFQVAASLTGSGDGTARFFQCCNMLGHCFMQKGVPQAAVSWFKKGLNAPGRNIEESKALQYELGSAYEQMGDLTNAVAAFTDVYGVDVGYRDTAERLASLQASVASQDKKKKD
jgi:tetratricopeptide (TPR) repeat protein